MTAEISRKFNNEKGYVDFPLSDVISLYHGILLKPESMDINHKTLNFLTGQSLKSEELQPAVNFCMPFIKTHFQKITDIKVAPFITLIKRAAKKGKMEEATKVWLANNVNAYGETVALRPLNAEGQKAFRSYIKRYSKDKKSPIISKKPL